MTAIHVDIVAQSKRQIVVRITRPAGYMMPSIAAVGLMRSEIAFLLGTTPKDLKWYAEAGTKVVTPTEITAAFSPSAIREHADGTYSFALPTTERKAP